MRYEVFDKISDEKDSDYLTQKKMEEVFKEAAKPAPDDRLSLNDRLEPVFQSCSIEEKSVTLLFHTEPWMSNTGGSMHGGMTAALCDMTMGFLARYFKGSASCVTIHLGVEYVRGILPKGDVTVKAVAEKTGRNIYFMSAKVFRSSDGELAAFATAEFM